MLTGETREGTDPTLRANFYLNRARPPNWGRKKKKNRGRRSSGKDRRKCIVGEEALEELVEIGTHLLSFRRTRRKGKRSQLYAVTNKKQGGNRGRRKAGRRKKEEKTGQEP